MIVKFNTGQIIMHRKHYYRGVIIDVDKEYLADEEWYQKKSGKPKKQQPWYHILVDDGDEIDYAAEENLQESNNDEPIDNPLVDEFFTTFQNGKYLRYFDS